MATTIVPQTPVVDYPFGWKVWKVTLGGADLVGNADVTLVTLPEGTAVLDARVVMAVAEAGSTTPAMGVDIGAIGDVVGSVDLDATVTAYTATAANLAGATAVLSTAARDVVLDVNRTGTASTAPVFYVALLCGRSDY